MRIVDYDIAIKIGGKLIAESALTKEILTSGSYDIHYHNEKVARITFWRATAESPLATKTNGFSSKSGKIRLRVRLDVVKFWTLPFKKRYYVKERIDTLERTCEKLLKEKYGI